MKLFKIFYERILLCYEIANTKQDAIDKAYKKYADIRKDFDKSKMTVR